MVDQLLQALYALYVTRFRIYKIACPPQDKNLGREGPGRDLQLPQISFAVWIKTKRLCIVFYESSLSTPLHLTALRMSNMTHNLERLYA